MIPFRDDLSYNSGYQRILIGLSFNRPSKACRYTALENGIKSNEDKKANQMRFIYTKNYVARS